MAFFEFPHTRTYDSDLGWLIHAYQLLKAQADDIQGSIQQIVDETLNDPAYVARVLAVLAPLNVKYPPSDVGLVPAKGDGVTDDTDAITGMIAYAYEHNMPLLFPAGQYVVSGLTISNDMSFIGLGGTLFLKSGAVNPLITVKGGYLTATGLEFNGNIAGQTEPENVFVVDGGGFKLDNCVITGGVDGIHAVIDTPSFLTAVDIRNFTEYGIYVEGTSFINANGIAMDVASGGALRLMRVDASNCIFNGVESLAEVAIAFEVTGDFNYFFARVPNAKTPTSDGGQNNSYDIIGQTVQKKVTGKMTYAANESEETIGSKKVINAGDIVLNPNNPLTYKTPTQIEGTNRGYITFKDQNGIEYDIPTFALDYLKNIGLRNYKTIFEYGAVGDGVHDDTQAFIDALNDTECNTTFIPSGFTYVVHGNYTVPVNHILLTDGPINTTQMSGTLQELIPVEPGLRVIDTNSNEWSGERKTYFFRSSEAGEKGYTKHGTWFQGFNQSSSDNFVWNVLITLDTSCTGESDDVALYVAANGTDGTDTALWAIATSTKDGSEANPSYPKLGQEIAMQAKGDDANDMRHGLNIVMTPIANTVGANFGSFILLTGGDTGNSPGKIKRALCLGTMKVDAILAARENSNIQCTRGIDFSNMNFSDCAFYLVQGHKFRIDNFSFWEQGGELHLLRGGEQYIDSGKIYFDSADHGHLQLDSVDIIFNPVEWSGTTGATRALPVNLGGERYYLPLFPA